MLLHDSLMALEYVLGKITVVFNTSIFMPSTVVTMLEHLLVNVQTIHKSQECKFSNTHVTANKQQDIITT